MGRNRVLSSYVFPLYTGILFLAFLTYSTPAMAASVLITESAGSTDVTEGGNPPTISDDYDVFLDTQPAGDVTIGVTSNNTSTGVTVDKSSLTFTSANWNVAQTVTVTVVDDAVDETSPHISTINHNITASADLINYPLALAISSVTANITDNDPPPAVSFTAASSSGAESVSPAQLTVNLSAASSLTVTVDFAVTGGTATGGGVDYTLANGTLTFNPGVTAQTIDIAVVDDAINEAGETIVVDISSPTNATPGATTQHTYTINDNDGAPTVSFAAASSSGAESVNPAQLTVNLSAASGLTVTVDFAVTGGTATGGGVDYTLANGTLTFNPGVTAQTIDIAVVDDAINETDETIVVDISSPTNTTLGATTQHTYTINDNDTAGVTITESSGSTSVTEGGATDTYTIKLNSNPTEIVTITITPSNSQVNVNPSSLNISPGPNATNPRSVTVTAIDDALAEGNHNSTITHSASSSDTDYDGIPIDNVSVSITDNDSAAVNVSPRTVDIVEGSGEDTYEIVLTSEPTAAVTITITPDSQSTVNPPALTFDPGSGRTPQTVTVTAVDDKTNEGSHQSTITHSAVSADPGYDGIAIPDVTANITDNETQAFVIDPIGSIDDPIIVPEGDTGSFTVRLSAQPLPPVTIDATVSKTGGDADITVQSSGTLSFDSTNWDVPQTVTLAAAEDPDGSSNITTISVDASGVPPTIIVTAREADDDTITVTAPNGGEVWISGTTRSIRWDSSLDFTTDVNISILLDGILQQTFFNIENNGVFSWDILLGQAIDFTYRVRVTAVSDTTITDESDGDFSILDSSFDTDGDSISDFEEMGPSGMDNFYDGNGDGIPDWQLANANVASLFSFDGSHYVTFEADEAITNMQPIQPAQDAPQEFSYPYGFFIFEFDVTNPGDPATVIMYLDGEIPDTFVKFGATPDDFTPQFFEFTFDDATQTGAEIDDANFTVTLSFVDGLRGDVDIADDGTISDPGAPAVIIPGGISDGEATGSDCFIATAAFGSPSDPYVKLLRRFRDNHLLTNRAGQWFVDRYYRHSPPTARWLAKHDAARALVRLLLTPLIVTAWILLGAPLALPLVAAVPLMGIFLRRARARTRN